MSTSPVSLDHDCCRSRQRWLASMLQELGADCAILLAPEHVQYLTGFRPHRLMSAAVIVDAEARSTLIAPNSVPEDVCANSVRTFGAQWCCTLRQDQVAAVADEVRDELQNRPSRVRAVEYTLFPPHLTGDATLIELEPHLWRRRRKKDADELAMIARAIACTDAMYAKAKEIIEPGISELEVFNQLQSAAVAVAGEPLLALGNDYQSNSPGGPPRDRRAEAGELFVLDLGPCYRGYYADNCRTFAVNGKPTDEQYRAWQTIVACLEMVEQTVKPSVSCRELFANAKTLLEQSGLGEFFHHLGHGFGLYPHESPHLNPHWDDTFSEGDVFTAEPGLYGPTLRAGIRLEQDYRVTADGVERLTSFPLDLT